MLAPRFAWRYVSLLMSTVPIATSRIPAAVIAVERRQCCMAIGTDGVPHLRTATIVVSS